jgi:hypothetical protein
LRRADNILEAPSSEAQEIQMTALFSAGESKENLKIKSDRLELFLD